MSTEKGSAKGFFAVLGGIIVIGLNHPASKTARIPAVKKPKKSHRTEGSQALSVFLPAEIQNS
jgi:hypothetical protein